MSVSVQKSNDSETKERSSESGPWISGLGHLSERQDRSVLNQGRSP